MMHMELLRKLASTELPMMVTTRAEIESLRQLDVMGYVKAFIPPVHVDCDDCARQDPASVIEVTPRGLRALSGDLAVVGLAGTMTPKDSSPLPLDSADASRARWMADAWKRVKRSVLSHSA